MVPQTEGKKALGSPVESIDAIRPSVIVNMSYPVIINNVYITLCAPSQSHATDEFPNDTTVSSARRISIVA